MIRRDQIYRIITIGNLVFFICVAQLDGQISPGELSEAHAHLKGLSNCTKCHTLGEKVSNEKCLDCHLNIGIRISENRGYHASLEVKGKGCIECHSDHHGKNFQMVRLDSDQFDHTLTGYTLEGSHAGKNCKTCHKNEFITDPEIKTNTKVNTSTYLGLDQKCKSCHTDYHQGSLSSDCATCHDFKAFRPAPKFNHKNTQFPLRGKHSEVDCKLCHQISVQNGKELQKFTGIASGKCTNCHKDVHENKFGQNCTQCHSEVSFHQVKGIKSFNHSRTNYPLEGKHREVACTLCHKTGYTEELKYNRCSSCHSDYHRKQFTVQGKTPDCSSCHSLNGFEISSFTIERHNESPFQLTGAHLATPCFACHKKSSKWTFREIGQYCVDCHKDIHESTVNKKYDPEPTCVNCHTNNKWSEITFDHTRTGYTLEGAHLRQSCKSCHFKPDDKGDPNRQFSEVSATCINCHKDTHQSQFGNSQGKSCLKCHDYFDWSAGLFNHNQTAFPLDGKHENVACAKCHPKVATEQITYTLYKLKSFTCESCH